MSQQALHPHSWTAPPADTKAGSTGIVHTLTVKVNSDLTVEISSGKLDIKNGDTVVWNVDPLPAGYTDWEPVIQVKGFRFSGKFTTQINGSRRVEVDVQGETGYHQDSEEIYQVVLERAGKTPVPLTYKASSFGDSDPCLVIDNIGDPPGGGTGRECPDSYPGNRRPWGPRK